MTYSEFYLSVMVAHGREHDDWRLGQRAFNMLATVRPDLSEQIRGEFKLDPFYQNKYLPAFWTFISERWNG